MSRLLEAAQGKPPELTQAEDTLKTLVAERDRIRTTYHQVEAELREAREMLEEAEYKAANAEAKARMDDTQADGKQVQTARKNLAAGRETVERLEGTHRGLKHRLDDLRLAIAETKQALEEAEGPFRKALLEAFTADFEEAVKPFFALWPEGFALDSYVGSMGTCLEKSALYHPETRQSVLPRVIPRIMGETHVPTTDQADELRKVLRGLQQVKRLADLNEEPQEESEPLPAA